MVRWVVISQHSASSSRCSTSLSLASQSPTPSPSCSFRGVSSYSLRIANGGPAIERARAAAHRSRLFNRSSIVRRRGLEEKDEGRATLLQERAGETNEEEWAGSSAAASVEGSEAEQRERSDEGSEEAGKAAIAYLSASSTYESPVREGDVPVEAYLKLPIEQYFISDPSSISKVSSDEFLFQLPKLHFFNVWVAPKVKMTVQVQNKPKTIVNIRADECVVSGSKFIEKMRINERLKIKVKTSLEEVDVGVDVDVAGDGTEDSAEDSIKTKKAMKARTNLEVWCEIVKPFNLLPKAFLEKSCNAVLRTTLKTLLRAFMVELTEDYILWSTDKSYREERASRSL